MPHARAQGVRATVVNTEGFTALVKRESMRVLTQSTRKKSTDIFVHEVTRTNRILEEKILLSLLT